VTARRRRSRRRRSRASLAILAAALLAWLGGLTGFFAAVPQRVDGERRTTDAIVVLTGGRHRVERGLELLAEARAQKLFVSGVHPGVDLAELLRVSPEQPSWIACCVELGHAALDTAGNAAETAAWMRREGFASLRLVTADYHMPRAVLELRRTLPEAEILRHPVFPEGSPAQIFIEYHKYLGALLRPLVPGLGAGAAR
jgi:uncharacterized SAM-binding protein YcdF (DUF218 family)